VKNAVLLAIAVDTVTLTTDKPRVRVTLRILGVGSTGMFFTVDGSVPTVAGDNTHCVPPVVGAVVEVPSFAASDVVNIVSAGNDGYSIAGVD